jgi:hypothetical protein
MLLNDYAYDMHSHGLKFGTRTFAERHFAERHIAERHFAERTFCRTDVLPNGHFAERTFCRTIGILYTLDSASLLVKLKPQIFQRLPPFE